MALAALLQKDLSAVACLAGKGIEAPRQLDGKTYASYKARYEDEIVRQMVINDGGKGDVKLSYPAKLGIWNTIRDGSSDATWIFQNWEGLQAESEGMTIKTFAMNDFGVPYSYSPVLAGSKKAVEARSDAIERFLKASKKGFLFAIDHPEEAAKILAPFVAQGDTNIDLVKSQKYTSAAYGTESDWGKMEAKRVQDFLDWLHHRGLESTKLNAQDLVHNALI